MMYRCPLCDGDALEVCVTVSMTLTQEADGNMQTHDEAGSHEWDDTATMICTTCGHVATAADFTQQDSHPQQQ